MQTAVRSDAALASAGAVTDVRHPTYTADASAASSRDGCSAAGIENDMLQLVFEDILVLIAMASHLS